MGKKITARELFEKLGYNQQHITYENGKIFAATYNKIEKIYPRTMNPEVTPILHYSTIIVGGFDRIIEKTSEQYDGSRLLTHSRLGLSLGEIMAAALAACEMYGINPLPGTVPAKQLLKKQGYIKLSDDDDICFTTWERKTSKLVGRVQFDTITDIMINDSTSVYDCVTKCYFESLDGCMRSRSVQPFTVAEVLAAARAVYEQEK